MQWGQKLRDVLGLYVWYGVTPVNQLSNGGPRPGQESNSHLSRTKQLFISDAGFFLIADCFHVSDGITDTWNL